MFDVNRVLVAGVLAIAVACAAGGISRAAASPVDATLANGMHVVVVRNRLAPVVTTSLVYGVGGIDDTIPGIAHATEHMMFRGTDDVSSDQFANIATRMGAQYNAETTTIATRYYFTVPASYLDVVLRLEADRMQRARMSANDWKNERGAIEQEVKAHESNPLATALKKMNDAFYGDSPWGRDAVGTVAGFQRMQASDIAAFYKTWYHPNNATLVVVGDVDPQRVLASVQQWFGGIAAVPVPAHPALPLAALPNSTIAQKVDFPISFAVEAFRLPGFAAPDYAATRVLFAALDDGRGALADLSLNGKALAAVGISTAYRDGGAATFVEAPLPGTPAKTGLADLDAVLAGYAKTGIPSELIADAKARLLASQAYEAASIPGQAQEWSEARAIVHRSPSEFYQELERVNADDVNRVMRTYITDGAHIALALEADPSAAMPSSNAAMAKENVTIKADDAVALPTWTDAYFSAPLQAPRDDDRATTFKLANGMTIAVREERFSPTFVVRGAIQNNPDLYEPRGKEGVAQIAAALMPLGTTTYDAKAYEAQLDAIAASVSLGTSFAAQARAQDFDRTIALLADGELHPGFAPDRFAVVARDTIRSLAAVANRPETKADLARLYALYPPNDPHRRHATAASASAVTLADVRRWYAFAYRPDLTTISVVGDVAPERVKAVFEKYFGAWKAVGKKPSMAYPPIKHTQRPSSTTIASNTSKQSDVTLTERVPLHHGDDDLVALDVANTMLSGEGTGSMLFRDVRKAHGYVYSIDSNLDVGDSGATFLVEFAADPKNVAAAQRTAYATIERLRRLPPTAQDLALAKAMLLSNYTVSLDSYSAVASTLLDDVEHGVNDNDVTRYYRRVLAVTPADVQRAMRRWIDPKRFTRVILAPSAP
ncbi:MAG: insulinase family protein [bacterium]|nr:insulinase family protein [bacterium]